jgi:hypothetical protein
MRQFIGLVNAGMMAFGVLIATMPYIVVAGPVDDFKLESLDRRLTQIENLDPKTVMALFDRRLAALEKQNEDGLLIQKLNAGGIASLILGGGALVIQHRKLRIELNPDSEGK